MATAPVDPAAARESARARLASFVTLAVIVAILAYWGVVKLALFHGFHYISDLFSVVQVSRSWMDGRPIVGDTLRGSYASSHNYYTMLLLGPLTAKYGAYGLFFSFLTLMLLGVYAVLRLIRGPGMLIAGAVALGPVAFWIWDNPTYGFHCEIFFLPLGLLQAWAIAARSWLRWPLLVMLAVTQEQGPIVAMGIHLLQDLIVREYDGWRPLVVHVARIVGAYALLFIAGMWLIHVNLQPHEVSRTAWAFDGLRAMVTVPEARARFVTDLINRALLFAPLSVITLAFARRRLPALLGLTLALAPLLAVAIVGRGIYGVSGGENTLGLTWPARVVAGWTVGVAAVAYALRSRPLRGVWYGWWPLAAAAALLLVWYQNGRLLTIRGYDFRARFAITDLRGSTAETFNARELGTLTCLARAFGRDAYIAPAADFFAIFHGNLIVWPHTQEHSPKAPRLIACDALKRTIYDGLACNTLLDERLDPRYQFQEARVDGLRLGYTRFDAGIVAPCLRP